ncbi:MAG: type II toxin-antitoxin system RelE/ParE family toxin [Limosilactobacillus sp.]|uniref:type II toxin-antitoxin system RelE/ParE family toxin n=1 Tax=Limosilactobacillus sp. TaxID=2773925 RepID=UPI0025C6DB20|nr:type II toxin-antitoxin system RelE/ParE family toxin [Limosilactobacillus sp.]MCI1974426.1 type II toxin-antitoxin system RelE/ParE family toxin [Limosilactobacillus sp.]
MKNYHVVVKPQAERDLKQLKQYLQQNFGNDKAKAKLDSLKKSVLGLGTMPNLGRNATELYSALVDYQYLHLPKNTIFYQVDDKNQLVVIIRVFNNRSDVITHLLAYMEHLKNNFH